MPKWIFPYPVNYSIIDGSTGNVSSSGQSSIISFEVGDQLEYQYPCYYEELDISPTYSIIGDIKNHTYDVVSFDFLMSAFEFGFEIPEVVVIPGLPFLRYMCPSSIPMPNMVLPVVLVHLLGLQSRVVVPDLGFPGFELSVGPLWSTSLPIGSFSYDWYEHQWELEVFHRYQNLHFK